MEKLTIIIPMYNEERYIARCLESLTKQTYENFEVILIDDGSSDNTINIANNFKNKLDLKILKQKHGGPGKARNLGAQNAEGNILIFVDADMYFDKNYLKNLTKPIINKDEKGTSHGTELIGNPENIFARIRGLNRIKSKSNRTGVFRAILKNTFIKNGGFNPQKGYFDDDLSKIGKALFVKNAICFHNNPETLGEIYKHSQRVGKSFAKNKKILISYLKKYISIIILFIIILIFLFALFYHNNTNYKTFKNIFVVIIIAFFIISEILAIYKIIKDKKYINNNKILKEKIKQNGLIFYINYLRAFPLVWIARLSGYLMGFIKGLFKK